MQYKPSTATNTTNGMLNISVGGVKINCLKKSTVWGFINEEARYQTIFKMTDFVAHTFLQMV